MSVRALRLLADTASRRCVDRVERRSVAGMPSLVAGQGPAEPVNGRGRHVRHNVGGYYAIPP